MTRVLLIGLDGFSPDLVSKWLSEGRLPHLARLSAHGVLGPLRGVVPPVTYPAWTSCVTGVNPGRHGMLDFTGMIAGRYALRFLNSSDRKAPALWNILSDAGKRVCVLGVPGTYPPEPVNGILLSGFDSPVASRIDRSFVYPREAYAYVRGWRFAAFQEHRITPKWYGQALRSLERKIIAKTDIARGLLTREPWDFFMIVFGEADTVSHHCWPLEDENSPRRPPTMDAPAHPIRRIYECLDNAVGALAASAGEQALVLVVSDHGFGGADAKSLYLNNFLAEQEWLQYCGASRNLIKTLALRVLPVQGRDILFRWFRKTAEGLESRARFADIDWTHTRAWSDELDYFPSVRVNLAGREPEGIVQPDAYDHTVQRLCELLETLPDVARALPRSSVYTGPYTCRAPDIILELAWDTGYRISLSRARGGPVTEALPPNRRAGGKERGCSGVHRNPALLATNRPSASAAPSLYDIAPTVLEYLDVAGPAMDGVSLFSGKPADAGAGDWTPPHEKTYTEGQETLLESRMRELGYFE